MGLYVDRGYTLEDAKSAGGLEIESWYGSATLDTFESNVLGSVYRYECNEAAQLRFINGKVSNTSIDLMCGPLLSPDTDPVWGWTTHSAVECGKVHSAYLDFSKAASLQYNAFKAQLIAATSVAEVDVLVSALWG